jgi:hypothetical protein
VRFAQHHIALIRDACHAMMLSIATAAGAKARHFSRTQRQQRRDNRKTKDGQQQDGKQPTH